MRLYVIALALVLTSALMWGVKTLAPYIAPGTLELPVAGRVLAMDINGGAHVVPAATEAQSQPPAPAALSQPAAELGMVQGSPSITAAQIDEILAGYNSPAMGTGQAWYDLGVEYQIDPAYAVAFFVHESTAGTAGNWAGLKADGSTTHNIGNIICAGYSSCYGRFRDYPSWEAGIEAWYRLIAVEYIEGRGTVTVAQIVPIYAPSFENNVEGYIAAVDGLVEGWRAQYGAAAPQTIQAVQPLDDTRQKLVAYALSLDGIPYVRGGRSASGGDCSGTMQHIYLTVAGIDIGGTTFSQYPNLQPIDLSEVQPGDLWYGQYSDDQHTGMVADVDGDGRWDLINNGGIGNGMHVDYDFLQMSYFADHTMGFRRAL